MAYFVYDTILGEIYGTNDALMRFHHLFSLVGGPTAILNKYGCSNAINGIIVGELSNPFMLTRVLLKTLNLSNHGLYTFAEITFAVVFIICRAFVGVYYSYANYMCTQGPLMLDLVNSAFMILSSFWLVTILSTIGMKFAGMYKGEKPVLIRGYVWFIGKISRNLVYRILFHGGITAVCMGIPLVIKIRELVGAS